VISLANSSFLCLANGEQKLAYKIINCPHCGKIIPDYVLKGETNYISKVAKTEKDICILIEAGFEYVTEFEGSKIFRKRKL
jgi:hypothetical protein